MKILILNAIGKTKFGGGEKWAINAARGLQERGHIVYLGCRPNSVIQRRAEEQGIRVKSFNILSDISPYNVIKMTRFLKSEQIDVILSKNRDFAVAGIAGKLAGTPLVVARHGLPLRRNIFKHKFFLNRFADGIIANAKATKDLYVNKGWFPENFVEVIYNGVDINTSVNSVAFDDLYPGKKIILSAGRLSHQKGFTYLIDAAGKLKNIRDDFLIIVLGEGKLRDKLLERVKSSGLQEFIQFTGFVKSVAPYIQGCDVFVLPSLYEGLSNAALEAMMCRKTVILTDVNGAREIITDGVNGLIVPPRDADALAKSMDKVLSNDDLRKRFGEKAFETVHKQFTVDKMIDDLERYITGKLG